MEVLCRLEELTISSARCRPWFAKALMSDCEPMCTPWAASFNACIISARRHVQIMRSVLLSAERAGLRWWFFLCARFPGVDAVISSH